jgi:protein SCO1
MTFKKKGFPIFVLFILALPIFSVLSSRMGLQKNRDIMAEINQHNIDLPAFQLINQSNDTFTKANLVGKVTVVSFIASDRPEENQQILSEMSRIQKELTEEDSLVLLTICLNPIKQNTDILQKYSMEYKADLSKWSFLSLDSTSVTSLIDRGFQLNQLGNGSLGFCNKLVLVDRRGHIKNYYNALDKNNVNKLQKKQEKK